MSDQASITNRFWWRRILHDTLRKYTSAQLWRTTLFLVLNFFLGILWFCVLLTLLALGISTAIIWVGVVILAITMWLWIKGAEVERRRIVTLFGEVLPSPYRPLPSGSSVARAWSRAGDLAVWRDLLYLLLLFPAGILEIIIVGSALVAPIGLIIASVAYLIQPGLDHYVFRYLFISNIPTAMLLAVIGILWLLTCPYLVIGAARGHVAFARTLLGPSRRILLEARVAELNESRSRVIDTSLTDRQRIERDLHDGAQQRLVSLAMNLGMAREKLATDPMAAQELVTEAHEEAKNVLAEIRNLVRGIYPSVLADRGLDAAISALVSRCPVPVTVTVDLERRLPDVIESTAYFLIAEAFTNVARHSHASEAWIVVRLQQDRLLVEVRDNGVGGADPKAGTGLTGLAARVAAIDGLFAISSPPQGPTRIYAELPLPCES